MDISTWQQLAIMRLADNPASTATQHGPERETLSAEGKVRCTWPTQHGPCIAQWGWTSRIDTLVALTHA